MSSKLSCDLETEDVFIMEFRELIDGNFIMILNGDKLKARIDSENYSIDLNSPIIEGKLNPVGVLFSHRIKTFLRGAMPDVIKKEITKLNSDVKLINSFVKKYGFEAIEVPIVRNYFRELVNKARNMKSDESGECKKKLNRLIVAMAHTDKKVRILRDISIPNIVRLLEKIEADAKSFYPSVVNYCMDCKGKKSSYSKCEEKLDCQYVVEHIKRHFPDYKQGQIKNILTFNTSSEYIAETFRKKLGVDRTRGEEFLRYAKSMRKINKVKSTIPPKK